MLRPGQALESEEAAAQRATRVSAALQAYRSSMGLDLDPAVEAQATALFEEGEALFRRGALTDALER